MTLADISDVLAACLKPISELEAIEFCIFGVFLTFALTQIAPSVYRAMADNRKPKLALWKFLVSLLILAFSIGCAIAVALIFTPVRRGDAVMLGLGGYALVVALVYAASAQTPEAPEW